MKINDIIRTRRLALGLIQEGLADKLGVSAPAVNKWERGLNYPDITLLPPLARTLGVDLNTLLSFQEDLSQEEIGQFLNQLGETGREMGCAAAFQMAREKLREFPNSDLLAYSVAGMLEGLLVMYSHEAPERQAEWEEEISRLYHRSVTGADPQIQQWAAYTLAFRCINHGELDQAEELAGTLPDTHRNKQELMAALRQKQGRREEAWILLERSLFDQAHAAQSLLLRMMDLALEEENPGRARLLSDRAAQIGRILDLSDYAVLSAPFQLAMAQEDGAAALDLLEQLLHSLTVPLDLSASPLYAHLATKSADQTSLLKPILDELELDPAAACLRSQEGYPAIVERYRSMIK